MEEFLYLYEFIGTLHHVPEEIEGRLDDEIEALVRVAQEGGRVGDGGLDFVRLEGFRQGKSRKEGLQHICEGHRMTMYEGSVIWVCYPKEGGCYIRWIKILGKEIWRVVIIVALMTELEVRVIIM